MGKNAWNKRAVREFRKELTDNGYEKVRTHGSHDIYKNVDGKTIVVNLNLNHMVMNRLKKTM